MIIGVPKEIKNNENRVALTPAGIIPFVKAGHKVLVETNAGVGSGFRNADYVHAGAEILESAAEVWEQSEMIMKVKSLSSVNMLTSDQD